MAPAPCPCSKASELAGVPYSCVLQQTNYLSQTPSVAPAHSAAEAEKYGETLGQCLCGNTRTGMVGLGEGYVVFTMSVCWHLRKDPQARVQLLVLMLAYLPLKTSVTRNKTNHITLRRIIREKVADTHVAPAVTPTGTQKQLRRCNLQNLKQALSMFAQIAYTCLSVFLLQLNTSRLVCSAVELKWEHARLKHAISFNFVPQGATTSKRS